VLELTPSLKRRSPLMRIRYSTVVLLALALILGGASTSHATQFTFCANLDGLQEVPPNGSSATGTATLVYEDVTNTLTTNGNCCNLSASFTASHIHGPAAPGANAGVLHPLAVLLGTPLCGSFNNDVWSGLTAAQVGFLNSGLLYINVHSMQFPGGEIRGQILTNCGPTPNRPNTWGRIKTIYR